MDAEFYNEASASKLGWTPDWFGCSSFDEELTKAVKKYQKSIGLKADGLCGPGTYRRIWTDRESKMRYLFEEVTEHKNTSIVYNNDYFDIDWPKVVLPFMKGGLKLTKGYKKVVEKRNPTNFVCHWDVCLNSKSCHRVLQNRGLSVHFLIDNDGTIYQLLDMNHIAYHAGGSKWNANSIGVEISNAYYPKHQNWYKKHGFGERPIWREKKVHGSYLEPFLGFYDVQLEALKALMKAVNEATGIPLETPNSSTTSAPAVRGAYKGFISHYHLKKNKIDCAGLDLKQLIIDINEGE
jgi:hypothetical protein